MNVMIFDTEARSVSQPFCYDVGYNIIDTETKETVKENHYIIEQTWHNLQLFATAFYADKRPDYVKLMRAKKALLRPWGYVTQAMIRDIDKYEITDAYAYNSDYDDNVFKYNCDWFKTINPFDNIAIHDIWGYASQFITNTYDYRGFCDKYEQFTDAGNYKGSAESVYRYIINDATFEEKHMGVYDSQIEKDILLYCIDKGAEWNIDYEVNKYLQRVIDKPMKIMINGEVVFDGTYKRKYQREDKLYLNT